MVQGALALLDSDIPSLLLAIFVGEVVEYNDFVPEFADDADDILGVACEDTAAGGIA